MPITLTPKAADKVRQLMDDPEQAEATGLRVSVVPGGCSGLNYKLALERTPADVDEVLDCEGVSVYVDPKSMLFLDGIEIDYTESMMGSGFQFSNPNATGTCGCGTSFTA